MKTKLYNILSLIMVLALAHSSINAQKLKYKDIYPLIEAGNSKEAAPLLSDFLRIEPDHPSANFQLALIYEKRYLEFDPLTEIKAGMINAEQAKMRYVKAKVLVDEKEVKRNTEYYSNFATDFKRSKPVVEFELIKNRYDSGYALAELYLTKTPIIQSHFTKSVSFYDRAVKDFLKIVGVYKSLKDVYLFYDEKMDAEFSTLKANFDSSVFYFNKYQTELKDYPFNKRDQQLMISDIITYRLDGIVNQTDFLIAEIPMWNYGKWVDEVKKVVNSDIKNLRKEIDESHATLQKTISDLQTKKPTKEKEEEMLSPIDPTLVLKIRKFDITSVTASLFQYEKEKLNVLNDNWRVQEMDLAEDMAPENKLQFYSRTFNKLGEAESALEKLKKLNDDYHLNKYNEFFAKKYNGKEGFGRYLRDEESFIGNAEEKIANSIFSSLIEVHNKEEEQRYITYQKMQLPLFAADPDSVEVNQLVTTHMKTAVDGSTYLAGYQLQEYENTTAYVAKVQNNKVVWFKNITTELDDAAVDGLVRFVGDMLLDRRGVILAVHTFFPNLGAARNHLVFYEESGEQRDTWTFEWNQFPRQLLYNDLTSRYTIALKGDFKQEDIENVEKLAVYQIDEEGFEIWDYNEDLIGQFTAVSSVQSGTVISSVFSTVKNEKGDLVDYEGLKGVMIQKLDQLGELKERKLIKLDDLAVNVTLYRISDEFISLADLGKLMGNPLIFLFNSELEMHYSAIKKEAN